MLYLFTLQPSKNRSGNRVRPRNNSVEVSPTSSVTGTTRAIIERTRSATRSGMLSDEKAATLPRKSGGMFVKAHQNGIRNRNIKQNQIKESFVDGTMEEEKAKTQTLPRSYKTGSTKNRTVPDVPNAVINRAQSTNNVMDHGIHLVVSSNSFVSRQKQQIRPVLTVQEKLAQDSPSLPPQVKKCSFKNNNFVRRAAKNNK